MATGWGIPEIEDSPGVFVGTTAKDIQRITASKYQNAGILTGCKLVTRSDWLYQWTAGAVVMDLGSDYAVEVPVYEGTLSPSPAPATGERVDTIYVEQLNSSTSNLTRVVVTSGSAPANAVVLDKRRVPAGATRTSQTVSVWDRRYARASQSTQGRISSAVDAGGDVRTKGTVYKRCSQRFFVDTDRFVNLKLSLTPARSTSAGVSSFGTLAASWGSLLYKVFIDDNLVRSFEVPISRMWATQQLETIEQVSMGSHTCHITSEWKFDGDSTANTFWVVRHGGADKHPGDALTVFDAGVSV